VSYGPTAPSLSHLRRSEPIRPTCLCKRRFAVKGDADDDAFGVRGELDLRHVLSLAMATRTRKRTSSRLRSLGDSTKKLKRTMKTKRKPKLQSTGNATIVPRALTRTGR
jgi:hypothetical protein